MKLKSAARRAWLLGQAHHLGQAAMALGALQGLRVAYAAEPPTAVVEALRRGGIVAAFRHAQAPGNFDPPGFKLGECVTQRNLGDAGREQARQLGAWFRLLKLTPRRVRSSPWCRCVDTATLAFGPETASKLTIETWDALGSTQSRPPVAEQQIDALRRALAELPPSGFEVWVSHQSTLGDLVGQSMSSAEGLLLRLGAGGKPQVLARLQPA